MDPFEEALLIMKRLSRPRRGRGRHRDHNARIRSTEQNQAAGGQNNAESEVTDAEPSPDDDPYENPQPGPSNIPNIERGIYENPLPGPSNAEPEVETPKPEENERGK